MSATPKRYCTTCTPGRPTILSMYNKGDICGACELEKLKHPPAPVEPGTNGPLTDDELLDEIRHWVAEHGRTPTQTDREGLRSSNLYAKRFGSWSTALARSGFRPKRCGRRSDTGARCVAVLALGEPLTTPQIARCIMANEGAVYNALRRAEARGEVVAGEAASSRRAITWTIAHLAEKAA